MRNFIHLMAPAAVMMFVLASPAGAGELPTKKAPSMTFREGVYTAASIEATLTLRDGRADYFQLPRNFYTGHHWMGSYSVQGDIVSATPEVNGTFGKRLNWEGKAFQFRIESDGIRKVDCTAGDACLYRGPQ